MKLKTVYEIADELAPFSLSREYCAKFSHFDNSGVIADSGEEVLGVLFALDLSRKAAEEAKRIGANCIFTHHPAIYAPLSALSETKCPGLLLCLRAGISVLSAHLNLDAAKGGIDERLMQGLGGKEPLFVMDELTGGGYGRVFEIAPTPAEEFAAGAEETFQSKRIVLYGNRTVRRVASFCGAGLDERALSFALEKGADTVVSSDGKHHLLAAARERGLNVLLLTHYAAEFYGFRTFYETMKERLEVPCSLFADEDLL